MHIGQEITFTPHAWIDAKSGRWGDIPVKVTGTIVYINRAHRYARVAYKTADGTTAYECFKF